MLELSGINEKKVLNELEQTYGTIMDISRKLGDERVFEKLCPNTPIDEILITIDGINERLKFIYEQVNRLKKEE